jgi:enterochelin esterase family protein
MTIEESIQSLLQLLEISSAEERLQQAEELWTAITQQHSLPLVHDNRAYFVFRGEHTQNVMLVGDWTYWQPAIILKHIDHTPLFYTIQEFHPETKLQYKYVADNNWILDPVNKRVSEEGFGINSEFWMPRYKDESWLDPKLAAWSSGKIQKSELYSRQLGSTRPYYIYTPAHPPKDEPLPLLLIHDGEEAIRIGHFNKIIDNLTGAGKIPPMAVVFLPPHDRINEYALSSNYPAFCAEEVLPHAIARLKEQHISVMEKPHARCVTGASLGGLLSTKISSMFPDAFGSCIAQSPSYWWNQGEIFRSDDLHQNARKCHFYLQTGTVCDAQRLSQIMFQRLRMLGATVHYQEFHQGHTWGNWRSTIAIALQEWASDLHALTSI